MKEGRPGLFQGLMLFLRDGRLGGLKEKDIKSLAWIVLLGLIGVYLLVAGGRQGGGKAVHPPGHGAIEVTDGQLTDVPALSGRISGVQGEAERRLASALSRIKGAGVVEVCIWFEGEGEREFAWNSTEETRTAEDRGDQAGSKATTETRVSRELVLTRGASGNPDSPIVSKTLSPRVEGVLVLADGAIDSRIKLALSEAVTTFFGIPAHKVMVLPRQK